MLVMVARGTTVLVAHGMQVWADLFTLALAAPLTRGSVDRAMQVSGDLVLLVLAVPHTQVPADRAMRVPAARATRVKGPRYAQTCATSTTIILGRFNRYQVSQSVYCRPGEVVRVVRSVRMTRSAIAANVGSARRRSDAWV